MAQVFATALSFE